MIFEQWVMIGAQVARLALARNGAVEHAAQRDAVDIASVYSEANDSARELIHDDEHPVALEQNGFAAKEIDAPEADFHVTDESQPGGTTIMGCWTVMFGEDTPHDVLVDVHAEGLGDDQRDSRAAESRIASLQLHNRLDQFL